MPWNELAFQDALTKKYAILKQNADSETTKANAAAQDVAQKPGMQQASDAAAMARARLGADTSLQTTDMNNAAAMGRAQLGAATQKDIVSQEQAGAMGRAQLGANTQTAIAGMENATKNRQLDQNQAQFDKSYGLDVAKSYDKSQLDWAIARQPTMGPPSLVPDPKDKTRLIQELYIKNPGVIHSGTSPFESLAGVKPALSGLAGESDTDLALMRRYLENQKNTQ